jgi:hypothetical protein
MIKMIKFKAIIKKLYLIFRDKLILGKFFSPKFFEFSVDVTGGFGSQLISLGALTELQEMGYAVRTDLKYFESNYKLDSGITKFSIEPYIQNNIFPHFVKRHKLTLNVRDSPLKFKLGLRSIIKNKSKLRDELLPLSDLRHIYNPGKPTLVIHVRKGYFLQVSNNIIAIEDQLKGFTHKVLKACEIIIVTDSREIVEHEVQETIKLKEVWGDIKVYGPEELNLHNALALMISADFLIACNSQLSLIGSILNENISLIDIEKYVNDQSYIKYLQSFAYGVSSWKA